MITKTKRFESGKTQRLACGGKIKDIIIKEDFLDMSKVSIILGFRGNHSSGIVELNAQELELIYKKLAPKLESFGKIEVKKFAK